MNKLGLYERISEQIGRGFSQVENCDREKNETIEGVLKMVGDAIEELEKEWEADLKNNENR